MEFVRTAVIGYGGMGKKYVDMLAKGKVEGIALQGVCCRNHEGQMEIRNKYPETAVYRKAEEVFEHREELDAVLIVTPHDTHAELGICAFRNGLHVFMDKPTGISAKEARELNEEAGKTKAEFAVMFQNRTRQAFIKARELIQEGKLGRLVRAVWICNTWYRTPYYHNSSPWRSSWKGEHGGLLINQCQHYLDIWQWILGMPNQIDASIDFGKYNDFTVDDSVDLRFLYDNGLRGTFISSSGETPGVNRFEIWGTRGRLTIEDDVRIWLDENEMSTIEFNKINTQIYGTLKHQMCEIPVVDIGDPYVLMLNNFASHILRGDPLIAPGEEGLNSLLLANGSYLSAWLEKNIRLPFDDDVYMDMLSMKT